jgi:hypothetical protein
VVPLWRLLRRKGKPRTAKGLAFAACVTLGLNALLAAVALLPHYLPY